jgi:NADH dehydrogenase
MSSHRHRVVVVGGGFAGLQAVRALKDAPTDVTLVDRQNFHLFQPLAYQVATGALAPSEIAAPLRAVLKRQANATVLLGDVTGFDLTRREVLVDDLPDGGPQRRLPYDTLVVAGGAGYSYFGHDEWAPHAPELKSLTGALDIRARVLRALEAAELEEDPERLRAWLTFVVVGAGPTGVEMAGQIAELAHDTVRGEFRSVDTRRARVLLVELADRVLTGFVPSLSRRAERALRDLGVEVRLQHRVVDITPDAVAMTGPDGALATVGARSVVWAAGVTASPLAALLARAAAVDVDRGGRVPVGPDLSLPGHPEVLALGDMVRVHDRDGNAVALPGLAPVAIQEGRYAGRSIHTRLGGGTPAPFHYRDKGNLATIGRSKAVAELAGGIRLSGRIAWLTWLVVHLFYLVGFQNRLLVALRWTISYLTRGRGARLIVTYDRS